MSYLTEDQKEYLQSLHKDVVKATQMMESGMDSKLYFDILKLSPIDILLSSKDYDLYSRLRDNNRKEHITTIESDKLVVDKTYYDDGSNSTEYVFIPLNSTEFIEYTKLSSDDIKLRIESNEKHMISIREAFLKLIYRRLVLNLNSLKINNKEYRRKWIIHPTIEFNLSCDPKRSLSRYCLEIKIFESHYYLIESNLSRNLY